MNVITLFVILAIYCSIFLAQRKRKEEGTVVDFEDFKNCRNGGFGVTVKLSDGREARATVGGCTICMNNLKQGSKIKLIKLKDRKEEEYVIAQSPFESLTGLMKGEKCNSRDSVKRTV